MDGQKVSLGKFSCQVLAMVFALTLLTTHAAQAQTFSVLHNFTGGADGASPDAGVTVGPSGVLYGTAQVGGTHSNGTVVKLSQVNSSWVFSPLYEFTGGSDGGDPYGGLVIGPNGALYGTTQIGGYMGGDCARYGGCGTVFELRPPATFCRSVLCYWNETVLYSFMGAPDGEYPGYGNLAFDQAGDIFGTTSDGGMYGVGTAFELTPSSGGYTESILHSFGSGTDGEYPSSGVVLDTAGNMYGTTFQGGTGTECPIGCGTVYQLMPSTGSWLENVLVNFNGTNGSNPLGGLVIDQSGNLYGTTGGGGQSGGDGVVYELALSDGAWTYSVLHSFGYYCGPAGGVAMDAAGNFFGACDGGSFYEPGWVFELTNCSQGCTVVDLHDFRGNDGEYPWGTPVLDANGNLYGTTEFGGTNGDGVVWEIAGVGAPHKK